MCKTMKLKIFTIARPEFGEEAFDNWHRQNPGIKINSKHICAHGKPERLEGHDEFTSFDRLYVFYDTVNDYEHRKNMAYIEENTAMEMQIDIAKSLRTDPVYKSLTNMKQRRLYLLHTKMLPTADADAVVELLTPQLSSLLE